MKTKCNQLRLSDPEENLEKIEDIQEWKKALARKARNFDPMTLAGTWPGDETLEEILADLD